MARRLVLIVSLAVLTLLPVSLDACGGSPPQPGAAGVNQTLFGSQKWGIAVFYPSAYVQSTQEPDKESGALVTYLFANPDGAMQGGTALDVLQMSVFQITPAVTLEDLRSKQREFQNVALRFLGTRKKLRVVTPFTLAEVGDSTGLSAQYVFTQKGREMAGIFYLVPKGERLYWVAVQTSRQTWDTSGREMGSSLQKLTLQ